MIGVLLSKDVRDKVVKKYTSLYRAMKQKLGTAYPKTKLADNIRNALSINGTSVDILHLKEPIYNSWKSNNLKVIKYNHWYYAIRLVKKPNGVLLAYAIDVLYEGDYHNDVMQTQPYVDETILKVLNLIERMNNLQNKIRI